VDEQRTATRKANDDVLPTPVDRCDAITFEHRRHDQRIIRAGQPRVVDLDLLQLAAIKSGGKALTFRFDLGSSGIT